MKKKYISIAGVSVLALGALIPFALAQSTNTEVVSDEFKNDLTVAQQEIENDQEAQNNQQEVSDVDDEKAGDENSDVNVIDGENDQDEIDSEIDQDVGEQDDNGTEVKDEEEANDGAEANDEEEVKDETEVKTGEGAHVNAETSTNAAEDASEPEITKSND